MQAAQNPSATPQNSSSRGRHLNLEEDLFLGEHWTPPHSYNVINGHDYTDAPFVEVDRTFTARVAPGLPEIPIVSLFGLTTRIGPGARAGYDGRGWQNVLAVRTPWDRFKWLPISTVVGLTEEYAPVDRWCRFRVWFCEPGLLHFEVDKGGTWTTKDVLDLPKWMFVG